MQTVSKGDNLHEMSDLFSGKNIIDLPSAQFALKVVKVYVSHSTNQLR